MVRRSFGRNSARARLVLMILTLQWGTQSLNAQAVRSWDTGGRALHLATALPGKPDARWRAFLHLHWNFDPPVQVEQVSTRTVATRQFVLPARMPAPLLTPPVRSPSPTGSISTALPEWYVTARTQTMAAPPTGYTSIPTTTTITTRQLVTVPTPRFQYGISFVRCGGLCW